MKCMDHLCEEILPEEFIYSIIKNNRNLIYQYNENKIREEILNNPNKKFCPYPNCNSYMKREKHEKNVKCGNGHLSCFYCLKKPHEGKCIKELDEKMEEYAKKKFIKKCPNLVVGQKKMKDVII
jgi:ariadne-1